MRQEGDGGCGDNGMNIGVSVEEKNADQIKLPQSYLSKNNYAVIAICAVLSMIFMRTGLLSLFFLVPLGYAVLVTGSIWVTFFTAAFVNTTVSLIIRQLTGINSGFWLELFFISIIFLMYLWIIGGRNLRTTYRFVLASAGGAIGFIVFIFNVRNDSSFYLNLANMAESMSAVFAASPDAPITAESLLELIKGPCLRGCAVFSMFVIFFLNRQLTLTAVWLIKKQRSEPVLMQYFSPPQTIWVLSGALATVLISSVFRIEILEILSWNVLTISAILFLAQGAGIVMHVLSRRTSVFRIMISVLFAVLIVTPMGLIIIAGLLLLGIAETWLPMRMKSENREVKK